MKNQMSDLYFCHECKKIVQSLSELYFVEENSTNGFCSEACIEQFYKSLVANLSIYPEKQRILLLSEIVRLSNYSGEWNTGSITNERIDIMDIFRQIPLSQLDDTLVHLGLKLSEMSRDIKIELLINTISTASPKSTAELNIDSQTTLNLD